MSARNYGKRTRRYAVGGIVPKQEDDDASDDVMQEARKHNYDEEKELELPQNRNLFRKQDPDNSEARDYVDPDWRDDMMEDT